MLIAEADLRGADSLPANGIGSGGEKEVSWAGNGRLACTQDGKKRKVVGGNSAPDAGF